MLTLCGADPFDRLIMSFGPWGVPPNVMNCVEFGFDRWRGFGPVGGPIWPIAIHLPTRPYNFASTTVQQVIYKANRPGKYKIKWGFTPFKTLNELEYTPFHATLVIWFVYILSIKRTYGAGRLRFITSRNNLQ